MRRLQAVSLKILLLLAGLHDEHVPHRIYIADPSIPPHKVAFNHTSSPSLRKRRNHALMCEVSYSASKPARPDAELVSETAGWLFANGFIDSLHDVVRHRVVDLRYGYPVPTHDKPEIVAEISEYLEQWGIYSIGRFGSWSYANSDECMRQGLELARRISGGSLA